MKIKVISINKFLNTCLYKCSNTHTKAYSQCFGTVEPVWRGHGSVTFQRRNDAVLLVFVYGLGEFHSGHNLVANIR